MNQACPSNLALDALRLGLDRAAAAHVAGCARCSGWMQAQDQLEARVAGMWVPPRAVEVPRPPRRFTRILLGLCTPAVAVVALIVLRRQEPPGETAKGNRPRVEIARMRQGVLSWLADGDQVAPGDALRFLVHRGDAQDGYVIIGSVDGSGRLVRFYPAERNGCSLPLPSAGQALDGSITLDDAQGPERMLVLVSHRPLCWDGIEDAATLVGLGAPASGVLATDGVHAIRMMFVKRSAVTP